MVVRRQRLPSAARRWRRGWDSNPRYPRRYGGFQDRCLKPLGHPSGGKQKSEGRKQKSGFGHFCFLLFALCLQGKRFTSRVIFSRRRRWVRSSSIVRFRGMLPSFTRPSFARRSGGGGAVIVAG